MPDLSHFGGHIQRPHDLCGPGCAHTVALGPVTVGNPGDPSRNPDTNGPQSPQTARGYTEVPTTPVRRSTVPPRTRNGPSERNAEPAEPADTLPPEPPPLAIVLVHTRHPAGPVVYRRYGPQSVRQCWHQPGGNPRIPGKTWADLHQLGEVVRLVPATQEEDTHA